MSRDMSDIQAQVPAAGLDEAERLEEVRERMKDEVVDVGPAPEGHDASESPGGS